MEGLVQCPVCTLYLHNGMTLESHLDTHPKDQVIKALCNLSVKPSSYGSRTPTPSERSYRSRSRTPATEDSARWSSSHRNVDSERYWHRTPCRTPKLASRSATPDVRSGDLNFECNSTNNSESQFSSSFSHKTDKTQQTFIPSTPMSEIDHQYVYYGDRNEDKEIKYSRSAEYNAVDNPNNVFTYSMPEGRTIKLQGPVLPPTPRKSTELLKILPTPNNILVKANVGGMQYQYTPRVKPTHLVVSPAPTFLQKNVQSNLIMTGSTPTPLRSTPQLAGQFNPISSTGTTVVTQNSQFIYREMVHNLDGKPFISNVPTVLTTQENINVAQSSSMYQNVMIVDQFGNSPCMYGTPPQLVPKTCSNIYNNNVPQAPTTTNANETVNDVNKTLIIEIGPIVNPPTTTEQTKAPTPAPPPASSTPRPSKTDVQDQKLDAPGPSKGLKILSNIKVEVPVQHHKNMLNTVMDLTGSNDNDYAVRPISPERILPDLEDNNQTMSDDSTQPSVASGESVVSHSFSVIKNVGNPPSYKDSSSKSSVVDNKMETEFSDSCPVPDLICNEKPSISPCSELSEAFDSSTDNTSLSPKPQTICSKPANNDSQIKVKEQRSYRNNALRLNNIYVKKHKKVLQIKNAKTLTSTITSKSENDPEPSSSASRTPESFSMNKTHKIDLNKMNEKTDKINNESILQAIDKIKKIDNDFDADTEEQSMDLEPVAPSSLNGSGELIPNMDMVKVKEEINTSNEGGFSNETGISDRAMTTMDGLRPINVISYNNMAAADFDDESNHRELLDLEAVSKSKQFVNMMNDNYFGDNIYADYFTPDRVESFEAVRDAFPKDGPKDGLYVWGETSQKESEFVLPNFIHESYKIAESNGVDYSEMNEEEGRVDMEADGCERDSKADVLSESRSDIEVPLNICADERMPPRGELSGQESNGDMDTPWTGMYTEVTPSEPYDLIARESWVSDGSEIDATEKTDNLDDDIHYPKSRLHTCSLCGSKFTSLKEMRSHKALAHAMATSSGSKTSYSRLVTARTIKKEEKPDESILEGNLLAIDSKEGIASTMLQVYDVMDEAKPKIEGFVKQEPKRRRRDYVCPTCKVDQVTEPAFNQHLKTHPLECLTCAKCFFRRANLAIHIKTHLGIKNYKCEVCEKRFLTRQKLSEHHNVHTGRAPVKCTLCDMAFRRYSNMVQHRDRHHFLKKAKIRDFVCHCGSVFHSKAKLLWHKETHEEKPKACPYCSDKFVHSSSLTRHVRRTHNKYYLSEKNKGKAENVPCPVCKEVYLRSNLRSHLLTHSGKRPYHCIICNKGFTTKWNLKLHRWTHMSRSAKPYKCNLCKGAFIRQTEYISHMNAHKSVRPYTCNYCGCQFIRKYNCQRHVREHEMAKKYVCKVPECGKSFHRSYYLSEHMKVHSGARPFSCNICGKTSSNKSNHNKHVKIHHAREPVATEA